MRTRALYAVALTSLLSTVVGCASPEEDTDEADIAGQSSYLGRAVEKRLTETFPDERGKTWAASADNTLTADWIQQVPVAATWGQTALESPPECTQGAPACEPDFKLRVCDSDAQCGAGGRCKALASTVAHEGQAPKKMCIGHSDEMLDVIYDTILRGKRNVDITSLTPPDGRYEAAVRNAVTRLSERAEPPMVRMLFGDFPGEFFSAKKTEQSLTRDVPAKSPLRLVVGGYRAQFTSWNHSKIIAVDGKMALSGGTNMWTDHYLQGNPVRDISLRLSGTAAWDSHVYINQLWDHVCKDGEIASLRSGEGCLPNFPTRDASSAPAAGGAKVFAVGRLGKIGTNASTQALLALIDASKKSLRIAQQDLGPIKRIGISFGEWPEPVMAALLRAAARGVDIQFVLSNYGSVGGTPNMFTALAATYSNGWTLQEVHETLVRYGAAHPELLDCAAPEKVVCEKIHLMNLRSSDKDVWPNGKPLALHSKIVIADERAFYLGSENLYHADLAEFGYVIDDARATKDFARAYFDKLGRYSSRAPADLPQCK